MKEVFKDNRKRCMYCGLYFKAEQGKASHVKSCRREYEYKTNPTKAY